MKDLLIQHIPDQLYTGSEVQPSPKLFDREGNNLLVAGRDYYLTYENNIGISTEAKIIFTGRAGSIVPEDECNYTDSIDRTFVIASTTVHSFVVEPIPDQTYTGDLIYPDVVVKYDDTVLTEGTDYTLSYYDNQYSGVGKVFIKGKGVYAGTTSTTFNIVPCTINDFIIELVWGDSEHIPDYRYTGYAIKPTLYTNTYGKRFVLGVDYTVGYVNNVNVGVGEVIVTGIGNFKDTKYLDFNIVAKSL